MELVDETLEEGMVSNSDYYGEIESLTFPTFGQS